MMLMIPPPPPPPQKQQQHQRGGGEAKSKCVLKKCTGQKNGSKKGTDK
jgi:hypothetical protein